jgi:hypothetical protein
MAVGASYPSDALAEESFSFDEIRVFFSLTG